MLDLLQFSSLPPNARLGHDLGQGCLRLWQVKPSTTIWMPWNETRCEWSRGMIQQNRTQLTLKLCVKSYNRTGSHNNRQNEWDWEWIKWKKKDFCSLFSAAFPILDQEVLLSPTHPPVPYNLPGRVQPWLLPGPAPATDKTKVFHSQLNFLWI